MRAALQVYDYPHDAEDNLFGDFVKLIRLNVSHFRETEHQAEIWFAVSKDDPPRLTIIDACEGRKIVMEGALNSRDKALIETDRPVPQPPPPMVTAAPPMTLTEVLKR